MKTYKGLRAILAALGLSLLALAPAHAAPRLAISPLGLQITQVQEVGGTPRAVDMTARTGVINRGDPALAVRATLVSSSPKFIVLSVQWLGFDLAPPLEGAEISSDGQTIRGSKTYVDAISGTRTITEWEFHAEAE